MYSSIAFFNMLFILGSLVSMSLEVLIVDIAMIVLMIFLNQLQKEYEHYATLE